MNRTIHFNPAVYDDSYSAVVIGVSRIIIIALKKPAVYRPGASPPTAQAEGACAGIFPGWRLAGFMVPRCPWATDDLTRQK